MNETSSLNIFRPVRAGHRIDVFLGLKPQAESYCPFGAETEFFIEPSRLMLLAFYNANPGISAALAQILLAPSSSRGTCLDEFLQRFLRGRGRHQLSKRFRLN